MSETGEVPITKTVSSSETKTNASEVSAQKNPYQEFAEDLQRGKNFLKLMRDDFKRVKESHKETQQEMAKSRNVLDRVASKLSNVVLSKQTLVMFGLWGGEIFREQGTGDSYGGSATNPSGRELEPIPWVENIPGVEHMGNLAESYIAAYLTYYGLSVITSPFKEKVPEKFKVAAAFLASSAFFTATELGYIKAGTPDIADIPAGIIGPLIFSGVMLLNGKFIEDCGKAIKDLKRQIKREKTVSKEDVSKIDIQPAIAPSVMPDLSKIKGPQI